MTERPGPIPDRFWNKTSWSGDCLLWTGAKNEKGYGVVGAGSRAQGTIRAHVWVCIEFHGPRPSPDSMALHSTNCTSRACVNPEHLRWGTAAENSADMVACGNSAKVTRCLNGHPWVAENLNPSGGCKLCARERARLTRERKKLARTSL